jgi:hypothetical protein
MEYFRDQEAFYGSEGKIVENLRLEGVEKTSNKVFNLTAPFVTAFAFAKPAPIASRTGLQVKTALGLHGKHAWAREKQNG